MMNTNNYLFSNAPFCSELYLNEMTHGNWFLSGQWVGPTFNSVIVAYTVAYRSWPLFQTKVVECGRRLTLPVVYP